MLTAGARCFRSVSGWIRVRGGQQTSDGSRLEPLVAVAVSMLLVLSVFAALGVAPAAASDPFTYRANGTDRAIAMEAAAGSVSLNQSVYTEERGDVAEIGISLSNTGTATVTIGTVGDNDWTQNVTVKDGNGDDFVSLEFNTYTAGTSDDAYADGTGYVIYSVANDSDSVTNVATASGPFDSDSPAAGTLAAGDYPISAVAGSTPASETTDGEGAVATLSLSERSTDAVTTYVAPDSKKSDLENVSDIRSLMATDNVTEASEIANKDILLAKIDASGLEGVLRNHTDAAYGDDTAAFFAEARNYGVGRETSAWAFWINQTNADAYAATLNASNTELLADNNDDEYWLVVDTDPVEEFSDGDDLETRFTTRDENDISDDDVTVVDAWSFGAAEATVDVNADTDADGDVDEIRVQKAPGQEITGTTTVAPGTELNVKITGTDSGSPFVKPLSAVVQSDGFWTATADFSGNAEGANFTVTVRRGTTQLVDKKVDGRIAAAPIASVTFNDQESFGSTVTVDSVLTSDGGFVAIHLNNASGEIIGHSSYIEAGSDSDIDITLDRTLEEDATLVAMAHQDTDGDEAFEFEPGSSVDMPYTENDSAVTDSAAITVTSPITTTTTVPTTTGIIPTTTDLITTTTDLITTTTDIVITTTEIIATTTDIVTTTTDLVVTTTMDVITSPVETTTAIVDTATDTMTSPIDTTTTILTTMVETTTAQNPGFGFLIALIGLSFLQLAIVALKKLR